jgi:hypothetical protein
MDEYGPHLELIRRAFLESASDYSEEHWAAAWMTGLHKYLRDMNDDKWLILAHASKGWPNRDGHYPNTVWEPLTEDEERRVQELRR